MKGLWRSEWLRARSRRLPWLVLVAGSVATVVGVGIATARSHPPVAPSGPPPPAYLADLQACLDGRFLPAGELPPEYPSLEAYCRDTVRREFYEVQPPQLRLRGLSNLLEGIASIVVASGVVLGASLGGADWSSGAISTLLTWEPRRVRLLAVRAIVAFVAIAVIALVLQGLLIALVRVGVALRGSTQGAPPDWLAQAVGVAMRTAGVAALFGGIALSLATVGRSTVSALGALFLYLVGVEGFGASLLVRTQAWLLVRNAVAAISERPIVAYLGDGAGYEVRAVVLRTPGEAWFVLLGWAAILGALALWSFTARDVQ